MRDRGEGTREEGESSPRPKRDCRETERTAWLEVLVRRDEEKKAVGEERTRRESDRAFSNVGEREGEGTRRAHHD